MTLTPYVIKDIILWTVAFAEEFVPEFQQLSRPVRIELLAQAGRLQLFGPALGRPQVDTLNGSKHPNMKELRFRADNGVWRVAFAFDPTRSAILLVAGDKSGVSESRFYRELVARADRRLDSHLARLAAERKH